MASYVLNLKLDTEKYQEHILEKRFEIARKLYNSVLNISLKRYKEMVKTKIWRDNQKNIFNTYKTEKDENKRKKLLRPFFHIRKDMLIEYRISEYALHSDVKNMQKIFKENIDSFTAQKIASRVWKAFDKLIYGDGEKVKFKAYSNCLKSLEGKSNTAGIRYKDKTHTLEWNKLSIKVQSKLNDYELKALTDKVKYCRIKRKFVRGKFKYILQLVLDGIPPLKIDKNTGEVKHDIGCGSLGIDIGTRTIAYSSNHDCQLLELAPRVQDIENEKRLLQRYMDRSKRATSPNNFNEDGTVKKGVKLQWDFSNRYIKAKNKLKDLYRKQADVRKQDHEILANKIISSGDRILVETMNFKALQKKAKNTTVNEKTGKIKKKKRFGKFLANKAPAILLTIIENKLKSKGGMFYRINTYKVKASQFNHLTEKCTKKKLSQRWNYFEYNNNKIRVQRDLYSSFLIKNVMNDLETIDCESCTKTFDEFLKYHDIAINNLIGNKTLSSMGI